MAATRERRRRQQAALRRAIQIIRAERPDVWADAYRRAKIVTPVIVVDTHRDGCTIATEDVPIYAVDDRPAPRPATDSIARARATLAAASERRAAEYRGGSTP